MSHPQFHHLNSFKLTSAWLNFYNKHMTTGRINRINVILFHPTSLNYYYTNNSKTNQENNHCFVQCFQLFIITFFQPSSFHFTRKIPAKILILNLANILSSFPLRYATSFLHFISERKRSRYHIL